MLLCSCMKLKEGAIFNMIKFEEGLSEIANIYYESGYMSNSFYPVPERDTDRKEISYNLVIEERARSHIENIIVQDRYKFGPLLVTKVEYFWEAIKS